jgi:hypothetical protein
MKKVAYTNEMYGLPIKIKKATVRTFKTRYKEHIQAIRNNNGNSGHTYGSITSTMRVLKTERKGKHLNTLEKYHIYKTSKDGMKMNDTSTPTTEFSR